MTFTEDQKNTFHRYEEIKLKIKELEEEAKKLMPVLLTLVPEGKEIKGESGIFSVQKRIDWKYSQPTQALEAELKKTKKEEIAKGIADGEEKFILYYKEDKERPGSFDNEFN